MPEVKPRRIKNPGLDYYPGTDNEARWASIIAAKQETVLVDENDPANALEIAKDNIVRMEMKNKWGIRS